MRGDATPRARPDSAPRRGEVVGAEREHLRGGFGRLVRRERVAVGLLQVDLAELIATDRTAISRLEAGRVRPTSSMCRRLSRALRTGCGEREVLALEVALHEAAGASLRGVTDRTRRRRDRLDAVALAAARSSGGDPYTNHLLNLLEQQRD
ncbi:helix-turn-helix domain-containing protein [Lentzea sp. NEAU-D13]|uniref:Helix-turn-helix domain-containing protein n=1 Tax=Lentzea alba TaxID=2714351 RepID=A0A7C9RW01_9PSEU|nr:helix-turn-helix domain-containing protein [Lentzea alba]NGY63426.1 helix-turn-helix domain-containing protein [Lentzea alba]